MELVQPEEKPVVIKFTRDEARRLADSLSVDFTWSETSEEILYRKLHSVLEDGLKS